jgi:hypothetical protein
VSGYRRVICTVPERKIGTVLFLQLKEDEG